MHSTMHSEFLKKSDQGFSMVEMLMTISLIAVLGAVASVQYVDYRNEAKTAATNRTLSELREGLVGNPEIVANGGYVRPGIIVDLGSVPATLDILVTQSTYSSFDMFEKRGWRGPYVNSASANWSKDGWGTSVVYSAGARTLKSCGRDRTCGNADDITVAF